MTMCPPESMIFGTDGSSSDCIEGTSKRNVSGRSIGGIVALPSLEKAISSARIEPSKAIQIDDTVMMPSSNSPENLTGIPSSVM